MLASVRTGCHQDGTFRRLLVAVLAVALTGAAACTAPTSPTPTLSADQTGGISGVVPGLPYRISADAGTFLPGHTVQVTAEDALPDLGGGRAAVTPLRIVSDDAPARPVTLETVDPVAADTDLTVAALWQPGSSGVELVSFASVDGQRLRVKLPISARSGYSPSPRRTS